MSEDAGELLRTVKSIHALLELLAEEKIAQRDARQRSALSEIVGKSIAKQKSVLLMDGSRTQAEIHRETSVNKGHLSTMVGQLCKAQLLDADTKRPRLTISIPKNYFESHEKSK